MVNSFWWQIIPHPFEVEHRFHHQQMVRWVVFELTIEISIDSWHVKFADSGIVVYEYVGFGFDVGDAIIVVRHRLVSWHQEYRSDHGWLSTYLDSLNSALRLEGDLSSFGLVDSLSVFRQELIHSCRFWWIVWWRRFQVRILACICWVIQGLGFLLGFVFPT